MYKGMCMYIHHMNRYMQFMYMVHTGFNQLLQQEADDRLGRRQLWRKGACTELRLACVARLIGPDEKLSVVVERYSLRRVCTMYIHILKFANTGEQYWWTAVLRRAVQGRSLADSESLRASQSQGQWPISQSGGGLEPYDSFRVQCFASNLGFWEIQVQVDFQTSDVMAGAGGGTGPILDVRHQPGCCKCLFYWLYTLYFPFLSLKY
jgi:hypothetical protein